MAEVDERDQQAGSEGHDEAGTPDAAPDELSVGNGSGASALDFIEQAIREQRTVALDELADEEPEEDEEPEDADGEEDEDSGGEEPQEDRDSDSDADEDDEQGEAEEEDEGEDDAPPETPEAKLQRHLAVLSQSPSRWSEIPAKERGPAIEALAKSAFEAGARQALEYAISQRQQEGQIREFVAEKDRLRRDDPDAFAEWADEHPDELEAFAKGKAFLKGGTMPQQSAGAARGAQAPVEQLKSAAQAQLDRLYSEGVSDEIRSAVVPKIEAGQYQLTAAGVQKLTADIDAAIQGASRSQEEARKRAAQRQKARGKRSKTARPDIGSGAGATPGDDISGVTDVRELLTMGHSQAQRRAGRGVARAAS